MGIGQTEQTKKVYRPDQSDQKKGYLPDKTDQNMGIDHNEQTDIWLLARPNRPIYGYYTNRTDRITVLARPTTTKYGH